MNRLTIQQTLRCMDDAWIDLVGGHGFRVRRSDQSYVWYDGEGTIWIAPDHDLDDDDFLGQILLHELCHWVVEGPASAQRPDWGLDNLTANDEPRERAALRVQSWLVDPFDLRDVFVATTTFRDDYLTMPAEPPSPRDDHGGVAWGAITRLRDTPLAHDIHHLLHQASRIVRATRGSTAPR